MIHDHIFIGVSVWSGWEGVRLVSKTKSLLRERTRTRTMIAVVEKRDQSYKISGGGGSRGEEMKSYWYTLSFSFPFSPKAPILLLFYKYILTVFLFLGQFLFLLGVFHAPSCWRLRVGFFCFHLITWSRWKSHQAPGLYGSDFCISNNPFTQNGLPWLKSSWKAKTRKN